MTSLDGDDVTAPDLTAPGDWSMADSADKLDSSSLSERASSLSSELTLPPRTQSTCGSSSSSSSSASLRFSCCISARSCAAAVMTGGRANADLLFPFC